MEVGWWVGGESGKGGGGDEGGRVLDWLGWGEEKRGFGGLAEDARLLSLHLVECNTRRPNSNLHPT